MLFGAGVSVPAGDDAQEMSCVRQGGAEGTGGWVGIVADVGVWPRRAGCKLKKIQKKDVP